MDGTRHWEKFLSAHADAAKLCLPSLPPALHQPPDSPTSRTFANNSAAQGRWMIDKEDGF